LLATVLHLSSFRKVDVRPRVPISGLSPANIYMIGKKIVGKLVYITMIE
jgi:hypothetical protein